LAERAAVQDCGDVGVGGEAGEEAWADCVDDYDGVVAVVCDVVDKTVTLLALREEISE
jgi:hypothetical protein